MKNVSSLLAGALLLVSVAPAAMAAAKTVTVKGTLIDMKCYSAAGVTSRKHGMTCGKACLSSGIPAGILVGKKAWTLATPSAPLANYVGLKIKAVGTPDAADHVFIPTKIYYWDHKMGMWMIVK